MSIKDHDAAPDQNLQYALGLARAFAGALIFAFPLFMTMEMWWIGFYMEPIRLLVFILFGVAVMMGLAYYSGFEPAHTALDAALDGLTAYGVGFITSFALLLLFGILTLDLGWPNVISMTALQAIPSGIGAVVARRQLASSEGSDHGGKEDRAGYPAQLFLMTAGAVFTAFNVAPTDEMRVITFSMSPGQIFGLLAFSVILLHILVYTVGFGGQEEQPEHNGFWLTFLHYTLAGYGLSLLVSLFVLWVFGRTDDAGMVLITMTMVVLAFPGAIGAAIARLVV